MYSSVVSGNDATITILFAVYVIDFNAAVTQFDSKMAYLLTTLVTFINAGVVAFDIFNVVFNVNAVVRAVV
jgi:hypothetical protein